MPTKKRPESDTKSHVRSISLDASDLIRKFVEQFEDNLIQTGSRLAADADLADYQRLAVRAAIQTLLDSGLNLEAVLGMVAEVATEGDTDSVEWTAELNKRRFALIDMEIQDALSPAEQIELAGLTKIMRQNIDSETNLPMEGARALHRKLTELQTRDETH